MKLLTDLRRQWILLRLTPLQRKLARQAWDALDRSEGVDVGAMSHAERDALFFNARSDK